MFIKKYFFFKSVFIILISQSPVVTASFVPFSPQLILGGTESGQLLLWDLRTKEQPVQSTPLLGPGYALPIKALTCFGAENAQSIASLTENQVCIWSLDNFHQPCQMIPLSHPQESKKYLNTVHASCFDFSNSDQRDFWIGTFRGEIYQVNRFEQTAR